MRFVLLLCLLLTACASRGPLPSVPPQPEAPALRDLRIQGPDAGLDWQPLVQAYQARPFNTAQRQQLEADLAAAYRWADWLPLRVQADDAPVNGLLRVVVDAHPPAAQTLALAAEAPLASPVPAPTAQGGARPEARLEERHQAWAASPSRVLVDAPLRRLYVKRRNGVVVSYPVAVGTARTPTPGGQYTVEGIRHKPTWYPPESIRAEYAAKGKPLGKVVPPGRGNPLGDWFIKLQNSIGIHGTNQPRSIGRAASHGCVRMFDADVAELVRELKPGDGVTVLRAPLNAKLSR